jgi:hypothetical protein
MGMRLNDERLLLIDQIFEAMGLHNEWEPSERIHMGLDFVLENRKLIDTTFPKHIVCPNKIIMWEYLQSTDRRTKMKSLIAFARRLARPRHFAIVIKEKCKYMGKKNGKDKRASLYEYKLLK